MTIHSIDDSHSLTGLSVQIVRVHLVQVTICIPYQHFFGASSILDIRKIYVGSERLRSTLLHANVRNCNQCSPTRKRCSMNAWDTYTTAERHVAM